MLFLVTSALFSCAYCTCFTCSQLFLFCFLWIITLSTSDGPSLFIHVYRIDLLRAQYVESTIGIALPRACEWYCRLHLEDLDQAKITVFSFCS